MPAPKHRPSHPSLLFTETRASSCFPSIPPMPPKVLAELEERFAKNYPMPLDGNPEFLEACRACDIAIGAKPQYGFEYQCFTQRAAWEAHKARYVAHIQNNWEWQHWEKLFNVNQRMLDTLQGLHKHALAADPAAAAAMREAEEILKQWGKL